MQNPIDRSKCIVLAVSDIQTSEKRGVWTSTGVLEAAINEGLDVYVVLIRSILVSPSDDAWSARVPSDRIFLADQGIQNMDLFMASGWLRCVEMFGLVWPTEGEEKETDSQKPAHWSWVRAVWLPKQGIMDARAFNERFARV